MSLSYKRTTCRLCDSRQVELAVPIHATPIADAYIPASELQKEQPLFAMDLYLCRDCGHVQILEVVDPKILFGNYIYTTSISLGLVEHFRQYAELMTRTFPAKEGALAIDIGSNDGTLLRFFRDKGLRVLGIDPAESIAKQATANGVETLPEFFTSALGKKIRQQYGPAHLVTANNVFAHSDALPDMADGICEMLAPDGVFVFEVSYLVDIVEKMLFDTVYHEHLCYHSIKPLTLFFQKHGLELFDVQRMASKGGSIRGFVQKRGGPRPVAPIVGELLALEAKMGLDQPPLFRAYSERIDHNKRTLLAQLSALKQQGKIIAGFGASATVTTLIYNFELMPYLDFLIDDNASRHGLFSPGCHLPVLSPQAVLDRGADYIVILAWQYATPILKKHGGLLDKGRHFIVPLPEVTTIPPRS